MDICFEGVGQVTATFQAPGEKTRPGMAVTLTGSGQVGLGQDGDALCGVVLGSVRNGAAAVQIGGAVKMGYTGKTPAAGWQELACDGAGNVKVGGGARCLVLAVDEVGKTIVVKL